MKIIGMLACMSILNLSVATDAVAEGLVSQRPDGSAIDWRLDRPTDRGKVGLVVLAQGSGCLSEAKNTNLAGVRAYFPDYAALTVEKYGVAPGDNPVNDHQDCSGTFFSHHTVSQRVEDYRQVIEELRSEPWWNGDLVLFGGSEGGMVMAMLAERVHPRAAVLMSTAGGITFGQMVREAMPKDAQALADAGFARARQNPQSSEQLAGQSLRFWADAIDRRVADNMLRSNAQFLLIQGGMDRSAPIGAARAVSDLFAAAGRCNLTYWEFPGYDHAMIDVNGQTRIGAVLKQTSKWLSQQYTQPDSAKCNSSADAQQRS